MKHQLEKLPLTFLTHPTIWQRVPLLDEGLFVLRSVFNKPMTPHQKDCDLRQIAFHMSHFYVTEYRKDNALALHKLSDSLVSARLQAHRKAHVVYPDLSHYDIRRQPPGP